VHFPARVIVFYNLSANHAHGIALIQTPAFLFVSVIVGLEESLTAWCAPHEQVLLVTLFELVFTQTANLHNLFAEFTRLQHLTFLLEVFVQPTRQVALAAELTHVLELHLFTRHFHFHYWLGDVIRVGVELVARVAVALVLTLVILRLKLMLMLMILSLILFI